MLKFIHILRNRIFGKTKDYNSSFPFRVMFVSPFFELEVDTGNGWHTVHSQIGEKIPGHDTVLYPILRFKSHCDAVDYATKSLGLIYMNPYTIFGFYIAPPASYQRGEQPKLIIPQYIHDGQMVPAPKMKEPQQVPGFVVHEPAQA